MRRLALVLVLGLVVAVSPSLAAPKAPAAAPIALEKTFGPLLAAAVPDADLVLMIDQKALGQGVLDLLDFVEASPVLAVDPALLEQWRQARAALMGGLEVVKATVGSDPLRDYDRIVGSVRLLPEGGDHATEFSLLVTGTLPADFLTRLFPDLPKTTVGGVEVSELGANPDAGPLVAGFLTPTTFLLAPPAVFEKAVGAKGPAKALLDRHEGLLAKASAGFLFRLSLALPAWVRDKAAAEPDLEAFPVARGLQRLRLDLDQSLSIELATVNDAAFESARFLLESAREGLLGSRALLRSFTLLALSLDLAKLPDIPAELRPVLADRKALQATLERLTGGADVTIPEVKTRGRVASLSIDRVLLLGGVVPLGVLAGVALPAWQEYQQKAGQQALPPQPAHDPAPSAD